MTPTYRIETRNCSHDVWTIFGGWDYKANGRANDYNLENWRNAMNESFRPGGVNYHCSRNAGRILHIAQARLVRQMTDEVVATAVMPMFEVA